MFYKKLQLTCSFFQKMFTWLVLRYVLLNQSFKQECIVFLSVGASLVKECDVTQKKVRKSHGNSVGKFVLDCLFDRMRMLKMNEIDTSTGQSMSG